MHRRCRTRDANDIGPGVYDIHSSRVPRIEEMSLLRKALIVLKPNQIWGYPDCALKHAAGPR